MINHYSIQTIDGENFEVKFSTSTTNINLQKEDLLFTFEEKCTLALKDSKEDSDPYLVIELAADLWSKRLKFFNKELS